MDTSWWGLKGGVGWAPKAEEEEGEGAQERGSAEAGTQWARGQTGRWGSPSARRAPPPARRAPPPPAGRGALVWVGVVRCTRLCHGLTRSATRPQGSWNQGNRLTRAGGRRVKSARTGP